MTKTITLTFHGKQSIDSALAYVRRLYGHLTWIVSSRRWHDGTKEVILVEMPEATIREFGGPHQIEAQRAAAKKRMDQWRRHVKRGGYWVD